MWTKSIGGLPIIMVRRYIALWLSSLPMKSKTVLKTHLAVCLDLRTLLFFTLGNDLRQIYLLTRF